MQLQYVSSIRINPAMKWAGPLALLERIYTNLVIFAADAWTRFLTRLSCVGEEWWRGGSVTLAGEGVRPRSGSALWGRRDEEGPHPPWFIDRVTPLAAALTNSPSYLRSFFLSLFFFPLIFSLLLFLIFFYPFSLSLSLSRLFFHLFSFSLYFAYREIRWIICKESRLGSWESIARLATTREKSSGKIFPATDRGKDGV